MTSHLDSGPIQRPGPTERLFGLDIASVTREEAALDCWQAVTEHRRKIVGVVNAAKIVKMRSDAQLRDSVVNTDIILADGMSVVWASRLLGRRLPERVTGIDLFEDLMDLAHRHGASVFLLGATQDVLDGVLAACARRWPGARIAGSRNGYFRDDEAAAVADQIRSSGADMLFVAMSSPRKENFIGEYGESLGVPLVHGVGGTFDVVAGVTRRAPQVWRQTGMEWAYRVLQEPRRLWKRYATTNCAFVALVAREAVHPAPSLRTPEYGGPA